MGNAHLIYMGNSLCEWAKQLDRIESSIHYGDDFTINIQELQIKKPLLHMLRCLSIAEFEKAERTNAVFREEVIMSYLVAHDADNFRHSTKELFGQYLKREWHITDLESRCAEDGLISIQWLMNKQADQNLNQRLHQAFDYIEKFHDIYTLDRVEELIQNNQPVTKHFDGLFERCCRESSPWLRHAKEYVLFDLLSSGSAIVQNEEKDQICTLREHYMKQLLRWCSGSA